MADCKTVTLTPFTVSVKESFTKFGGTTIQDVKRNFVTEVNECGGNTKVYEINADKTKTEKLTISGVNEISVTDKNAPVEVQKSLQEKVGKENALNQRLQHLKSLPADVKLNNNLLDIVEQTPEDKPPDAKAQSSVITKEQRNALQVDGVPANQEDKIPLPKNLHYPQNYAKYQQDFIRFQILDYKPRIFNSENQSRKARYDGLKETKDKFIRSEIILPIQGGINDSNTVSWNGDTMNAIEQAAAFASLSSQTSMDLKTEFDTVKEAYKNLLTDKKSNTAISSYLHAFFARMAANSGANFFSRGFGAILNPNLELLFQNPELRSFSLRFDLTPRNKEEAIQVKQIIRVFKQTMAPRKGVADIFLKTPMVYEIAYINGKNGKDHTSINKIKTCALKMFNVNYTPNNQYMTYNDKDESMTMAAYSLEMQFQELEPVFYDDYIGMPYNEIGY
jgi:hypothetical protein